MKIYQTEKRQELLALLKQHSDRAYSPEELVFMLSPDGRGKSTVYRLLCRFEGEGIVRKITDSSRRVRYQYIVGEACHHHLHMQCAQCGRLYHADEETSRRLGEHLYAQFGFSLSDERSVLLGTCRSCDGV